MNVQVPAHVANRQRRDLAETGMTGLSRNVPYISIEGQSFTMVDENGVERPVQTPYLDCVIIDVTPIVGRVFWGTEDGNYGSPVKMYRRGDAFSPPICFSDNGIGASAQAQQPQATNCKGCRWNEWTSSRSRMTGKNIPACGSTKKVAVYVPGVAFPFLLRVPVMSHENFKHYLSAFRGQEFKLDEIWTRVSFVHGQTGILQFEPTSAYQPEWTWVPEEHIAIIDNIIAHGATDSLIGRGDVVWNGQQGPIGQLAGPQGQIQGLPSPPAGAPAPSQSAPPVSFPPQEAAMQPPPPTSAPAGFPAGTPDGGKRRRGRPPKPEQGANMGATQASPPAAAPVPPMAPAAPAAPTHSPPPPPPAATAPFGIQQGQAPTSDMQNALSSAFGLPVGR